VRTKTIERPESTLAALGYAVDVSRIVLGALGAGRGGFELDFDNLTVETNRASPRVTAS
jgi:hypothetical protein